MKDRLRYLMPLCALTGTAWVSADVAAADPVSDRAAEERNLCTLVDQITAAEKAYEAAFDAYMPCGTVVPATLVSTSPHPWPADACWTKMGFAPSSPQVLGSYWVAVDGDKFEVHGLLSGNPVAECVNNGKGNAALLGVTPVLPTDVPGDREHAIGGVAPEEALRVLRALASDFNANKDTAKYWCDNPQPAWDYSSQPPTLIWQPKPDSEMANDAKYNISVDGVERLASRQDLALISVPEAGRSCTQLRVLDLDGGTHAWAVFCQDFDGMYRIKRIDDIDKLVTVLPVHSADESGTGAPVLVPKRSLPIPPSAAWTLPINATAFAPNHPPRGGVVVPYKTPSASELASWLSAAQKIKSGITRASIALSADLNQDGKAEGFFCTSEYGWDCFIAEMTPSGVKVYPEDISVQVGKPELKPVVFTYNGGVYLMAVGGSAQGEGWASWIDVILYDGTTFVTDRPVEVYE